MRWLWRVLAAVMILLLAPLIAATLIYWGLWEYLQRVRAEWR